jgi:nitrite reductase/ring-hydroxylating ferredoxin subunit
LAAIGALIESRPLAVEIEGRAILLVASGEHIYALDNLCPHSGARLDQGRIIKGVVSCPLHGAKFDLATGHCRTPQIAVSGPIVTHTVRISDGQIEVALADEPVTEPMI